MYLCSFGPGMAAVVVACSGGRAGLHAWLGRCLQWRVGAGWMALALFLPLALMVLAAALHIALGGVIAPSPAAGHALGPLQDRHGWRVASLVLGVIGGVWHLPLCSIDGTSQQHIPLALFMLSIVAMSVLFAWLAGHTRGSVVPSLVLHTAINAWPFIIPVLPTGESYRPYARVVALLVLLALGLLVQLVQPRRAAPATGRLP
jgi:membrane protease YdiL (CAAX protease family)